MEPERQRSSHGATMVVGAGPPGGLQRRRLSFQQPLQSKGAQRVVYSEKELLSALADLPGPEQNCYGKGISLVGPIQVSKTIVLGAQHSGLTINSPSRAVIQTAPGVTLSTWIETTRAVSREIILRDFVFGSQFNATVVFKPREATLIIGMVVLEEATGLQLQTLVDASDTSQLVHVEGCHCYLGDNAPILVKDTANLFGYYLNVVNNVGFTGDNGMVNVGPAIGNISGNIDCGIITVGNVVGAGSSYMQIIGNNTVNGIVVASEAEYCSIIGNSMQGGDITSNASLGNNTIVGNTNVGVLTSHGTDQVGLNS